MIITSAMTGQTTQTEYDYITKGFKDFITKGADIKSGYKTKIVGTWDFNKGNESRRVVCQSLIRNGEKKPCGTIVFYQRAKNPIILLCIPTPDADEAIWNQSFSLMKSVFNDGTAMQTLIMALMRIDSQEAAQ